jgi:hypothetical protein
MLAFLTPPDVRRRFTMQSGSKAASRRVKHLVATWRETPEKKPRRV